MTLFPALLYLPFNVTSHFAHVCFRFAQTTVLVPPFFLLCFIINQSKLFSRLIYNRLAQQIIYGVMSRPGPVLNG